MNYKITFELIAVPFALWVVFQGGWFAVLAAALWAFYEFLDGASVNRRRGQQ